MASSGLDFNFNAYPDPGPAPSEVPLESNENASKGGQFSGDNIDQLDLNTDLIGINRTTKDLNLVNTWKRGWTCKEAFRESYQNWRDGILTSFNLDLSQFHPTYIEDEKKRTILIEARHPDNGKLLGFIQFEHDKDGYCKDGLKIVNFKATLKYGNLGTGATTKAKDKKQTGQHGDGMKISALVYRRNNFNVCYESSGFTWKFIYIKRNLVCSLTRITENQLRKRNLDARGQPRTHSSHPQADVCLIVGGPDTTRNIHGVEKPGRRLKITEFKQWLTVTLDINPPQNIIRTKHGDLIRDPNYQGHMYLRGLRLKRGGNNGKNYAYGYNFAEGSTSSDRDALMGTGEESEGISAIWTAAMRTDESADSELVSDYTNLLLNFINKKGDVMMQIKDGKGELMQSDITGWVWAKMKTLNTDEEGRVAFYYSATEGKDVHIIENSLRKNPVPIDPELWRILKKHTSCRTPKDELLHLFKSAEVVWTLDDNFALNMDQLLGCLLLASPATQRMVLRFVKGEHLSIDAALFADTWKIHNKWLTWEGAHEKTFCEEDQSAGQELFSCDHAALYLWDVMISQLMASGERPQVVAEERWLKSMARSRLSQMPRSVDCFSTGKRGELLVTWESIDSHRHKHETVRVVLHQTGCEHENVVERIYIHRNDRLCSCPYILSQAVSDGVTFTGLNPDLEYRPSVSRDLDGAFLSLQPPPTRPLVEHEVVLPDPEASTEPVLSSVEIRSRSDGAHPVRRRSSHQLPYVSDDDQREDSGSLYQPSTISQPPSIPAAPPTPPAAPSPEPPRVRSKPIRVELVKKPKEDSYVLGTKIEHKSLDWGGSFPGSHDFYRTRDKPDQEIYILKPKVSTKKARHKRMQSGPKERGSAKKPRTSTVADRDAPPEYVVLSSPEPENDVDTPDPRENITARNGVADITPLPERGIVYRY